MSVYNPPPHGTPENQPSSSLHDPDRERGCFIVRNLLNGKKKHIKDAALAKRTAIALKRLVNVTRRRIPATPTMETQRAET